jgi:hypothetical protein
MHSNKDAAKRIDRAVAGDKKSNSYLIIFTQDNPFLQQKWTILYSPRSLLFFWQSKLLFLGKWLLTAVNTSMKKDSTSELFMPCAN